MLKIVKDLGQLCFSDLMEVYVEGNREVGDARYPAQPPMARLRLAEADFYQYLQEVFFPTAGAMYALWVEDGKTVSALRLEPYRDGLLLEALETAPGERRKGYAAALIRAVQGTVTGKLYAHVGRDNLASKRTHEKCGFRRISHCAVYIDGSVDPRADTLCYEK